MRYLLPLLLLIGCGSDSGSNSSKQPMDAGEQPQSDGAAADGSSDPEPDADPTQDADTPAMPPRSDVTITYRNRFGFGSGAITEAAGDTSRWTVFVVQGDQVREATRQADGSFEARGLARGPATLRVAVRGERARDLGAIDEYPLALTAEQHTVRFGSDHWAHAAQALEDDGTRLALSVSAPAGFVSGDTFSWISTESYLYRSLAFYAADPGESEPGVDNVPAEEATSSSNWTLDAELFDDPYGSAGGLPASGDDIVILQQRSSGESLSTDRFDPWYRASILNTVGKLETTTTGFANKTTNTVSGALTTPAVVETPLHVAGETFHTLREAAQYPDDATAVLTLQLVQEAGDGPQVFTSVALPLWKLSARSVLRPVTPECYVLNPATMGCAAECNGVCNNQTNGQTDPGELQHAFMLPKVASKRRDFYDLTYSYRKNVVSDVGLFFLSGGASRIVRTSSAPETLALTLGPVRDLNVGGLKWSDGDIADHAGAVEVSFKAPALGSPDSYEVRVIELEPDFDAPPEETEDARATRTVARYFTRATKQTIPAELLRAGHYYYVRVTAFRNGTDYFQPSVSAQEAYDATTIFSPPFRFIAK